MSLTFSFVSTKTGNTALLAVETLVKKGRLGPFELKTVMKFTKESALFLEVSLLIHLIVSVIRAIHLIGVCECELFFLIGF
jgi:hypothetical protein